MPTPETALKKQIKDFLKIYGYFVFHNLQGLGCYPGLPDLTAVKDGEVIYIEVKSGKNKLTPKQQEFKKSMEEKGGKVIAAWKLEDIIGGLQLKGVKV